MCQPGRPLPHGLSQPGSSGARKFPQHEIGRVALVGFDSDAGARLLLVEIALGQAPIVRHRGHAEQHFAAGHIGVAPIDQCPDHLDHLGDVVGGARLDGGFQAAERLGIGMELVGRRLRHLADGLVERQVRKIPQRPGIDLVVDVGDVADIGHVVSP